MKHRSRNLLLRTNDTFPWQGSGFEGRVCCDEIPTHTYSRTLSSSLFLSQEFINCITRSPSLLHAYKLSGRRIETQGSLVSCNLHKADDAGVFHFREHRARTFPPVHTSVSTGIHTFGFRCRARAEKFLLFYSAAKMGNQATWGQFSSGRLSYFPLRIILENILVLKEVGRVRFDKSLGWGVMADTQARVLMVQTALIR